jgi:hypothetical protein
MHQKAALAVGALVGAAAAFVLGRRRGWVAPAAPGSRPAPEDDLQAKLAEARAAAVDEGEFHAAGMASETMLDEPAAHEPAPADEFEAMRRRVHDEARAAADEMRRRADSPD